jgi:hypothetical protein
MIVLFISISLIFLAGLLHGAREAFHADRKLFENLFNSHPISFFGSQQDRLKYRDGDSTKGFKSPLWKYFPADFWHVSRWLENFCIAGAVAVLSGVWWYGIAYVLVVAAGGHLTYFVLRSKKLKN